MKKKLIISLTSFFSGVLISAVFFNLIALDAVKIAQFKSDYTISVMRDVLSSNPDKPMGAFPLLYGLMSLDSDNVDLFELTKNDFCKEEMLFPSIARDCRSDIGIWHTSPQVIDLTNRY